MECKYCRGLGRLYVERGSSLCYVCTDCEGSGVQREEIDCDGCGKTIMDGDECERWGENAEAES